MSVENIPVFIRAGDLTPIGFGKIVDDKLEIVVNNERIVGGIERMIQVGDIKELYLGFGFSANPSLLRRQTPE